MLTINLKLTEDEIQMLINGLGELPAKQSYSILNKILNQYKEQTKKEEPKESKKEG